MIFKVAPLDFDKRMDVVGCYLEHDGQFVLLHRPAHKSSGNRWGLPAGKVDPGEDIVTAMVRETFEETGVQLSASDLRHIGSVYVRDAFDVHYHMFVCVLAERPDVSINPNEHQAYRWVSPEEALAMDLIHDLDECIGMHYGTMRA